MLVETARFWASRGEMGGDGAYHLRNVMGPDEYHPIVDDNAYTNVLAKFNLLRAVDAMRILGGRSPERDRELSHRLNILHREPPPPRPLPPPPPPPLPPPTPPLPPFPP